MKRALLEGQFRDVYEAAFGVRPVFNLSYLSDVALTARTANTAHSLLKGQFRLA